MNWAKKQISTLLIISITSFLGTFLISSINIALPSIEKSLEMNAVMLSWVITSFLLATAMFLLPVGRWADSFGAAKLYKIGLIILSLASLACAAAPSGEWLIVARYVQGIGAAFSNTTGNAILISAFPPKQRGQAIGISVSSVYLGLSAGPFVGGIFTQNMGWQSIFIAGGIIGIISTIIAFLYLDKDEIKENLNAKRDRKGLFLFMLGLVCLVYGSAQIPALHGWLIMLAGLISLCFFWFVEQKVQTPVIDIKMYTKNRLFAYSNLAALINYCATSAIIFFLSLYLQKIQLLAPQQAGVIIIAQPIVMTIFSPFVGHLSDKFQPRIFATLGMAFCTVGLVAMAFLTSDTPHWVIVAILIWVGFGFALFSSPNMNIIMSSVERSQLGQASGSAASMRVIGQIISMTIVTLLFAGMFSGQAIEQVSDDIFLKTMQWGFLIFATISLVGIYFSIIRGNAPSNATKKRF